MPYRKSSRWAGIKPPPGSQHDWGHPLSQGLVSHWPMGDGGGVYLADLADAVAKNPASGANLDLTGVNWSVGKFGKCLKHDGSAFAGVYFYKPRLNTPAVSVVGWVNIGSLANAYTAIWNRYTSATAYQQLFVKSTGKLALYLYASADVSYDGTGTFTLAANTWYQLAFTYSSADGLKAYVNGRLDASVAANGALASNLGASGLTSIGTDTNTLGRYLTGRSENFRVYNRALKSSEIRQLYNDPFADVIVPRRRIISRASAGSSTFAYAGSGGIVFAGAATRAKAKVATSAGGIQFAGAATRAKAKVGIAAGGIAFAGNATFAKAKIAAGAGGVQFSGSALLAKAKAAAASGGLTFAGAATTAPIVERDYAGAGGIVFAGSGAVAAAHAYIGAGGITFDGVADTLYQVVGSTAYAYDASGGLVFDGSAVASYLAGSQAPTVIGSFAYAPRLKIKKKRYRYVARGGLRFGGRANVATESAYVGDGAITFGGLADVSAGFAAVAIGGVTLSGHSVIAISKAPTVNAEFRFTARAISVFRDQRAHIQRVDADDIETLLLAA